MGIQRTQLKEVQIQLAYSASLNHISEVYGQKDRQDEAWYSKIVVSIIDQPLSRHCCTEWKSSEWSRRRGKFDRAVTGPRYACYCDVSKFRIRDTRQIDYGGEKEKGKNMKSPHQDRYSPRYNPRKTSHRSHFLRITPLAQFCAIRTATTPIIL